MKNLMRKSHGIISMLGCSATLYAMIVLFGLASDTEPFFKLIYLSFYVPVFIVTVILMIKGINTIINADKLFIGNILKYEHSKETKGQIRENTRLIGIIIIGMFVLGMVLIITSNLFVVIPTFSSSFIIMKVIFSLIALNTLWVFLFGGYRVVMED